MHRPNDFSLVLFSLFILVLLTACVDQPRNELISARKALDEVVSEGAEIYTPEELGRITTRLDEAIAEIRHQNGLYFSNYGPAIFTLGQVFADAEALQGKLSQRKSELKTAAEVASQEALAAFDKIRRISGVPLQGGSDTRALQLNFNDLEITLEQVQTEIAAGEFVRARQLALDLTDRALAMGEAIRLTRTDPAISRR